MIVPSLTHVGLDRPESDARRAGDGRWSLPCINFHHESNNRFDVTIWLLATFPNLSLVTRWADQREKSVRRHEFEPLFDMLESGVVSQEDADCLSRHPSRSSFAAELFGLHSRLVNVDQLLLLHGIRREGPMSAANVLLSGLRPLASSMASSSEVQALALHASRGVQTIALPQRREVQAIALPQRREVQAIALPLPPHAVAPFLSSEVQALALPSNRAPHADSEEEEDHDQDGMDSQEEDHDQDGMDEGEETSPRQLSQASLSMLLNDEPSDARASSSDITSNNEPSDSQSSSSDITSKRSWHHMLPFTNPYSPVLFQYQPKFSPILPPMVMSHGPALNSTTHGPQ